MVAGGSGRVVAWCAGICLLACGGGAPRDPSHIDTLPVLAAIEELRLGSLTDPDVGFSRIGGVALDHAGNAYVSESQEHHVRVYDPDGVRIRTIGREGEGPGEFLAPEGLGFRGDTLWVADARRTRISFFDSTGTFLGAWTPAPFNERHERLVVFYWASGLRADGRLSTRYGIAEPATTGGQTEAVETDIPIVVMDTLGAIVDTLRTHHWSSRVPQRIAWDDREMPVPLAPEDSPLYADAEDDYIVVRRARPPSRATAGIDIARITFGGATLWSRTLRYVPQTFAPAAADSLAHDAARRYLRAAPAAEIRALAEKLRAAFEMPAFHVPVTDARIGADGSVWLKREADGTATVEWIVLAANGEPRGRVTLPAKAVPMWMEGARLWTAEPDAVDVPFLVRYRIDGASAGNEIVSGFVNEAS